MRSLLLLLICPLVASAADLMPITRGSEQYSYLPGSYALARGAVGAYYLPASLAYDPETAEIDYYGPIVSDTHSQYADWGMFLKLGGLGFGVEHQEDPTGTLFANRYRMGMGFGDAKESVGFSYNWSVGNDPMLKQPDAFTVSSLNFPFRWLSSASNISWVLGESYGNPDYCWEEALAFRPWTHRIAITGDMRYAEIEGEANDQYWVGAEIEPLDGVLLNGSYNLNEEEFAVGATFYMRNLGLGGVYAGFDDDKYGGNEDFEPASRYRVHLSSSKYNNFHLPQKPSQIARIDLAGQAGTYPWLFVGSKFTLLDFYEDMDAVEASGKDRGLLINLKPDFSASPAMLFEIRRRIAEYKEHTGNEVWFYCHGLGLGSLYLASIADHRAMLPIGSADLPTLGRESVYWGDAFEAAGVDYVRFNAGAFKGAGENYDLAGMSDEVRQNVGRALNEIYNYMTGEIQEGYAFSDEQMRFLDEHYFLTSDQMLELGLMDTTFYDDQLSDWVLNRGEEKGGINLGFIKINTSSDDDNPFSNNGIRAARSFRPSPDARRHWVEDHNIAVIYASGVIIGGESIGPFVIGHKTLVKQLAAARKNEDIKAVVLHIDSPGGSGYASDLVWREMQLLAEEKPLIVSQGFLAASGGYYLSMLGDHIFSTPTTITGSIGVAAGAFFNTGAFEHGRLRQDGVWAGKSESFGGAAHGIASQPDRRWCGCQAADPAGYGAPPDRCAA